MGTRAAVLILFSLSGFTQVDSTMLDDNKVMNHLAMQGFWTGSCVLAAILEIMTLIKCMQLTIMGNRLALLGGEGSMTRAVLIMRSEWLVLQRYFYMGLVVFHIATCLYVWNHWREEVGAFVTVVIACALLYLWYDSRQLARALSIPTQGHGSSWDEGAEGAESSARKAREPEPQTPRGDAAGASVSAPQLRRPVRKRARSWPPPTASVSAPQLRRRGARGVEERPGKRLKRRPTQAGQGTWRDFANSKQMVDMEIVGAEARGESARRARRRAGSCRRCSSGRRRVRSTRPRRRRRCLRCSGRRQHAREGQRRHAKQRWGEAGRGSKRRLEPRRPSSRGGGGTGRAAGAGAAPLRSGCSRRQRRRERRRRRRRPPLASVRPGSPLAMRLERAKGKQQGSCYAYHCGALPRFPIEVAFLVDLVGRLVGAAGPPAAGRARRRPSHRRTGRPGWCRA